MTDTPWYQEREIQTREMIVPRVKSWDHPDACHGAHQVVDGVMPEPHHFALCHSDALIETAMNRDAALARVRELEAAYEEVRRECNHMDEAWIAAKTLADSRGAEIEELTADLKSAREQLRGGNADYIKLSREHDELSAWKRSALGGEQDVLRIERDAAWAAIEAVRALCDAWDYVPKWRLMLSRQTPVVAVEDIRAALGSTGTPEADR